MDLFESRRADFSPCRLFRYTLWRTWDKQKPYVMFIGLNPSTADESKDDPTIRRCMGFAKAWGFGGLCMTNLFAYRATDPNKMKAWPDPIGLHNDAWLIRVATDAGLVVAAWGNHGNHLSRAADVRRLIDGMCCLGTTKQGEPKHPLYLSSNTKYRPL